MIKRIYPLDQYEKYLATFSSHEIEFKGVIYKTAEHAYHCQRYTDQAIRDEIQSAKSAHLAWEVSQKYKEQQIENFNDQKAAVMEDICREKVAQHADVKEALVESKDEVIVKNYPDPFWGIGMDGVGKNEMGIIWMKLRKELK